MLASLNPKRLMMLLAASERLFTASATMDTDPAIRPMTPLPRHKSRLQMMPTMPANWP